MWEYSSISKQKEKFSCTIENAISEKMKSDKDFENGVVNVESYMKSLNFFLMQMQSVRDELKKECASNRVEFCKFIEDQLPPFGIFPVFFQNDLALVAKIGNLLFLMASEMPNYKILNFWVLDTNIRWFFLSQMGLNWFLDTKEEMDLYYCLFLFHFEKF